MSVTEQLQVNTPQAVCVAGAARQDITPPPGIYHRMWGAATHDRATGIHRPLLATALVLGRLSAKQSPAAEFAAENSGVGGTVAARREGGDSISRGALAPVSSGKSTGETTEASALRLRNRTQSTDCLPEDAVVIVAIDHCLMWDDDLRILRDTICARTGIAAASLQIAFSHTHAAGLMDRTRAALPGGELIAPYLVQLAEDLSAVVRAAISSLQPASVVYGTGFSSLTTHRDLWDAERQQFVCGYHPLGPSDGTLQLARVSDQAGRTLAVVVNYACHPTTLAWDNTLISPDYVGALRGKVEAEVGGLCVFLQGASGDLGPREGFQGSPAIADRNGRELAYAVLATLESMPQAGSTYCYKGAVVSGATIGVWQHRQLTADEQSSSQIWRHRRWTLDIPYLSSLPTVAATEDDLLKWQAAEEDAHRRGEVIEARDCRAQCERMTRQLVRLRQLPPGKVFPLTLQLHQIGDGYWLWLEGEYYHVLQTQLRKALQGSPLMVSTVVNGWRPSYLPERETYDRNIYQEQVAVLQPGCLEMVITEITQQLDLWQATTS